MMKKNCTTQKFRLSSRLILLSTFFLFTFLQKSTAQQLKLAEKPEEFIPDFQRLMSVDGNTVAIESEKKFETQWNTFSTDEKGKFVALSRKMLSRGHKMPQFYFVLAILDKAISAENYSTEKRNALIEVFQKVVDNYDLKTATKSLEQIKDFMDKRLLYTANYNRLYALGGTYEMKFIDKKTETQVNPTKTDAPSHFDEWDNSASNDELAIKSADAVSNAVDKKAMPTVSGLSVELHNVDLVMATASDSVVLSQTNGIAAWKDGIFVGNGGKITWANADLPQVSATLNDYYFEIRNPKFSAEDVTLTYPERLNAPIKGVFEYKGEKRSRNAAPTYPRFMSYQGDAFIKNIDRNIEYKGGFALSGKRLYSSSLNSPFSTISVKKEGKYSFKATSNRFELGDSLITARVASFVTYLDKDSIYHPAVRFTYNSKNFVLRLRKIEESGFKNTPYSDSYHQMDIRTDAMNWDLNSGKMDFSILNNKSLIPTVFESFDYFNPQRVRDLSGSSGFNPLISIANYTRSKNKTTFSLDEIAQNYHLSPQVMRGGIMVAVQQGFVDYNPATELFKITKKGINYFLAFTGKRDFDDLAIHSIYASRDSSANATLNLNDKSLSVRGVRGFSLSDSLRVLVLPYDQTLKINKSRTFSFDGQIKVGNFRFAGKNLVIDYDNFTVDLNKIDSITFIPQYIYQKGGRIEIGSFVKYLNPGKLYISTPANKSGKLPAPEFPKLVIDKGVKVYFDEREKGSRKYNKKVYFDIPKIDFDSLNSRDIAFSGTFYSGGIFEPFPEKLIAMPDTTIGFVHKVPNNKYNVYGSPSAVKFASDLAMDGDGLHAEGSILHLAATLEAKKIVFMTDSLLARGQLGEIKEMLTPQNTYFPQVDIRDYTMKWLPKSDSMIVSTKEGFNFYSKTSAFTGKLIVRSGGLFGKGLLKRTDSETNSDQFKFNKDGFIAEVAQLKINSAAANSKPVLLGNNVNVDFNVNNNLVAIKTSTGNFNTEVASNLEFPHAAYKTNINRADWSIKDRRIQMKGDVNSSIFTSTNPKQEGLAFNGNAAIYEIEQQTLTIEGVPFIKSADAKIIPDKGLVAIRGNAEMLPFKNAHLTLDTLNGYHNLINGNIQILSKSRFAGDATYQFVSVSKEVYNIKMGNFDLQEIPSDGKKKEKIYSTVAKATVNERDSVFLSPKILYRGEVTMFAANKNLMLDGYVIPTIRKYPQLGGNWITYKGDKSEEIKIIVDKNLKSGDAPLYAGLIEHTNSSGIYPTFLSVKEDPEDHLIFSANGILQRDEPNKRFTIFPDKTDAKSLEGNRYELLDNGVIKMEGTFDMLSKKESQYLQTVGFAQIRLDTPKHEFNTMMLVNFPVPQPLVLNMAQKIVKTNLDEGNSEGAVSSSSPEFQFKMAQVLGDKGLEEYKAKAVLAHVPLVKVSPKFLAPIVFSDLHLQWSAKHNSFYSVGKLGVSNIGETDINTMMDGFVEIRKNPVSGDEVYIYLEASPNVWYYFGYREGQMGIVSSEQNFNDILSAKSEKPKGKEYSILLVDLAEARVFRQDFMKVYLGLKPEQPKPLAKDGKPLEKDNKPLDKDGKPVDKDGKPVDKDGKPVDKDKTLVDKAKDIKELPKKDEKKKKSEDEKEGF